MAEPVERSGGGAFIYFIVGALVVAVAVIAWIALANDGGRNVAEIDIDTPDIEAPAFPDAPDLDIDIDTGN